MIIIVVLIVGAMATLIIYTSLRNKAFSKQVNAFATTRGWQTGTKSPLVPAMQVQGYSSDDSLIEGKLGDSRFWVYVCKPPFIQTERSNIVNSTKNAITLLSVEMPITFSDLLLAPSAGLLNIAQDEIAKSAFGLQPLTLEGDFNKHFKLYTRNGAQIETLELFTPDVMADFEQNLKNSLLLSGNYLSIWINLPLQNIKELENILNDAQLTLTRIQNKAQYKLASNSQQTLPAN